MAETSDFKLGDIKQPLDDSTNSLVLQKEDIVVDRTFDIDFQKNKEELGLPVYTYHGGGYSYIDWNHRFFLLQKIEILRLRCSELDLILATLRNEVFRRGIAILPVEESGLDDESSSVMYQEQSREMKAESNKSEDRLKTAKKEEWILLNNFLRSSNNYSQSLQQVLEQAYDDLNVYDDMFIYYVGDYRWAPRIDNAGNPEKDKDGKPVFGWHFTFKGVKAIHPNFMEISVNGKGIPGKKGLFCRNHRTKSILMQQKDTPRHCKQKGCKGELINIYYVYHAHQQGETGGTEMYFAEDEITHARKNKNTELYGFSKLIPLYKKVMTMIGMDEIFKDYFFDRKNPSSLIFVHSDNPKDLQTQWGRIKKQLRAEADEVPMVAVSQHNQRGRIDHIKLAFTPQEMNYLELRNDLLRHIGSAYGVSSTWLGTPTSSGGLAQQTTELTVTSNVAERDQDILNKQVLDRITERLGVKYFTLSLLDPHEKAESTQASIALNLLQVAQAASEAGLVVEVEGTTSDILNAKYVVKGGQMLMRDLTLENILTARAQRKAIEMQTEAMEAQGDQANLLEAGGGAPGQAPGGGGGLVGGAPGGGGGLQLEDVSKKISSAINIKNPLKGGSLQKNMQNKANAKSGMLMKNKLRESLNRNPGAFKLDAGTVKNRKATTPNASDKTPYNTIDPEAQKE